MSSAEEGMEGTSDPVPDLESDGGVGAPSSFVEVRKASFDIDNVPCIPSYADDVNLHGMTFQIGQTLGAGNEGTCKVLYTVGPEHDAVRERRSRRRMDDEDDDERWEVFLTLKLLGLEGLVLSKGEFVVALKDGQKYLIQWKKGTFSTPAKSGWGEDGVFLTFPFLWDEYSNCLTVEVQLKLTSAVVPKTLGRGPAKVIQDLREFLKLDMWTDVDLKVPKGDASDSEDICQDFYIRRAHKIVLTARSAVFAAMFDPGTGMLEGQRGEVIIKDLSPKGLHVLLHFIYSGEVAEEWKEVPQDTVNIAEKYDFPLLKEFCDKHLALICNTENALELFRLAKFHGLEEAKVGLSDFISKNTRTILDMSPLV